VPELDNNKIHPLPRADARLSTRVYTRTKRKKNNIPRSRRFVCRYAKRERERERESELCRARASTASRKAFICSGSATATLGEGTGEGGELREQLLANRQLALGAVPGVERARVRTAPTARPESDHHVAAEGERSVLYLSMSLSVFACAPRGK